MIFKFRQIKDRAIARILTRHPALFRAWEKKSQGPVFNDSPWYPLNKAIKDCKVSLVTTAGVHMRSQVSFNMNDPNGDHTYREIATDNEMQHLTITHNYYEHKDADADINVVFPIEPLKSLAESGEIGAVNKRHYSFMGHLQNSQLDQLVQKSAPEVAANLKEDGVDVVVLSPAWGLCNQSVGLIQREIEKVGISTISITLSKEITGRIKPPRAIFTGFPLGHPFAFPNQRFRQMGILRLALKYLEEITTPGTIVDLDLTESDDPSVTCAICSG